MLQKIAVAAVLGFIVIAVAVFLLYQGQEAGPKETDYEPDFPFPYEEEYYQPVEPGSILDECGEQTSQYDSDLCWSFQAADELDASQCLNIEERSRKIICIRTIAADLPGSTQEKLAVCNQFLADDEVQRYRCHSEVAKTLLDYSICNSMPSQPNDYRGNCTAIVKVQEDALQ